MLVHQSDTLVDFFSVKFFEIVRRETVFPATISPVEQINPSTVVSSHHVIATFFSVLIDIAVFDVCCSHPIPLMFGEPPYIGRCPVLQVSLREAHFVCRTDGEKAGQHSFFIRLYRLFTVHLRKVCDNCFGVCEIQRMCPIVFVRHLGSSVVKVQRLYVRAPSRTVKDRYEVVTMVCANGESAVGSPVNGCAVGRFSRFRRVVFPNFENKSAVRRCFESHFFPTGIVSASYDGSACRYVRFGRDSEQVGVWFNQVLLAVV